MINNRFLHYKNFDRFVNDLRDGMISSRSIVFIQDKSLIWTHNKYYGSVIVDAQLSNTSTNPVQNKVVKDAIDQKANLSLLQYYATKEELDQKTNIKPGNSKGYFVSYESLLSAVPNPVKGDWAIINNNGSWIICSCSTNGVWTQTEERYNTSVDLTNYVTNQQLALQLDGYATKNELDTKQDFLQSGVNIKTINGETILGSGNFDIQQIDYSVIQQIQEDIQALQDLIQEESDSQSMSITELMEKYNAIVEFVTDLTNTKRWHFGDAFPVTLSEQKYDNAIAKIIFDIKNINSSIENINSSIEGINTDVEGINTDVEDIDVDTEDIKNKIRVLENKIRVLENNPGSGTGDSGTKCVILKQTEYNALNDYEDDAIYFIVESGLGKFPITLT